MYDSIFDKKNDMKITHKEHKELNNFKFEVINCSQYLYVDFSIETKEIEQDVDEFNSVHGFSQSTEIVEVFDCIQDCSLEISDIDYTEVELTKSEMSELIELINKEYEFFNDYIN